MSKSAIIAVLIAGLALGVVATLAPASDSQWVVNLKFYYGSVGSATADEITYMGVRSGATDGYDAGIDTPNPLPPPPGETYVDLYFYRTTWGSDTAYAEDFRAAIAAAQTKTWQDIRATSTAAGTCNLSWTIGMTSWEVPANYVLTLYDEGTSPNPGGGTPINMRTQSSYSFSHGGSGETHYFHITVFNDQNLPPTCSFTFSPPNPIIGSPVSFDGTSSSDSDGTVVGWAWDFGDGSTDTGATVSHTFITCPGPFTVALTVTDDDGATATCSQSVGVQCDPNLDWNCQLKAYWGSVGGAPRDLDDYFGVRPGATDGYDPGLDAKKPGEPFGNYVYAWFQRPSWGQGNIMHDWRSPVAEGTSKVWGTATLDTWNVKTNLDNGASGIYDSCVGDIEYPVAASIYLSWEFGVSETPPQPLPPDDYRFTLQYKGGINAKPAGTLLGDATMPTTDQTWDMEATPYIAIPLWNVAFQTYNAACDDYSAGDTARFKIIVLNPAANFCPTCSFVYSPASPAAGDTVSFDGSASSDSDGTVVSWDWDFGDGNTGSGVTTTHVYTGGGSFEACLTVTDDVGCPISCCQTVTVTGPVACFTSDPADPIPGQSVSFDGSCSSSPHTITSYAWDFGDGNTGSGALVSHPYADEGTYTVSLTITDDQGGTDTTTGTVTVAFRPEDLDWNCQLMAFWGAADGDPHDVADFLGVRPGATDGFDSTLDAKKPGEPFGNYVYAWFERPSWGQGRIMHDWRSPLPMGTTKVWGTATLDTWNVKTNLDNGASGIFDSCFGDIEYPVAASIYLSWTFGVSEVPPLPLPPDEYTFTLQYKGGIGPKPAGTMLGDATLPAANDTWDMEAVPYIVVPLWNDAFQTYNATCDDVVSADTARFKIIVVNPGQGVAPTCDISVTGDTECATVLTFNANPFDADGDAITSVAWDFGDGGTGTGDPATHAYGATGTYTVTCTVTDATGMSGACTTDVTITPKTVSFFLSGPAWHMISLPCEPVDPDPAAVFDELDPYGSPSLLSGNLHRFDPIGKGYKTWYNFNPGDFGGPMTVGEGYWLYIYSDVTITYEACCDYGERAITFPVVGWYMIGTPQFGAVDVRSAGMEAELGASGRVPYCSESPAWIGDPLIGYDPASSSYYYVTCGTLFPDHELRPYEGYWADVKEAGLTIYIPPAP
jgi:PKD repeat protein